MKNKKVVILGKFYFEGNTSRVNLAYQYFKENNDVKVIYSNFNHATKSKKIYTKEGFIGLKSIEYKKNISLMRIVSHIKFSFDAIKELKRHQVDLVYVNIPPNLLGYLAVRYCKLNKIKICIDVVDLWPEALPISGLKKKILEKTVGRIWRMMRTYALKNSNCNLAESQYFVDKFLTQMDVEVIPLTKDICYKETKKIQVINKEEIKIGYLGSMSHIYDFEYMIQIAKKISEKNKKIKIEIIGDGERRNSIIELLKVNKIEYSYYGIIFDEKEKFGIMKSWDWGFNGYKKSTEVALSYKSLDYMAMGIGLINSCKGDTFKLVKEEKIGLNYEGIEPEDIAIIISNMSQNDVYLMKNRVRKVFEAKFSMEQYKKNMYKTLKKIL